MKCRVKKIGIILFFSIFFILLCVFYDYKFGGGVSDRFDTLKKEVAFKTSRLIDKNFLHLIYKNSPDGDAYEVKKKNT